MFYVYLLRNIKTKQIYKGFTSDLKKRVDSHNSASGGHTTSLSPQWQLIFYCAFNNKQIALRFERYLKSGSGIAFLKKRFV